MLFWQTAALQETRSSPASQRQFTVRRLLTARRRQQRRRFLLPPGTWLPRCWTADPKTFNDVYACFPFDVWPLRDIAVVAVVDEEWLYAAVVESRGHFYFWDGTGMVWWVDVDDVQSVFYEIGNWPPFDWMFRYSFAPIPKRHLDSKARE